jgi:glycosyltransferase involved in cell wall biosynthesis
MLSEAKRCVDVSIVMPVHNYCEKYLRESILSVLNQDYTRFEFIIVTDRLSRSELMLLSEYKKYDNRIALIDSKHPGISNALNEGVRFSSGKYIARMDCDDVLKSNRLSMQISFLDLNPKIEIVGSCADLIDENGNIIGFGNVPSQSNEIFFWAHLTNPFIHPSVVFRKDAFEKVCGYSKSVAFAQDYDLWSRFLTPTNAFNLKTSLLSYRIHKSATTQSRRKEQLRFHSKTSDAMISKSTSNRFRSDAAMLRAVLVSTDFSPCNLSSLNLVSCGKELLAFLLLFFNCQGRHFALYCRFKIFASCYYRFIRFGLRHVHCILVR